MIDNKKINCVGVTGIKVYDRIYGEEEINEQVLIDLINSKSIQRLKNISQFGMPDKYYHKKGFSRYEHSLGVLIFLRRIGADLKEQIEGLIHDVSHTAFSHVIDWVVGDPSKEDYQDKAFGEIIKNSEIPEILRKNGFDYTEFLNIENFSLLEQPIPNLCADRFDYAIREIADFESRENIELIVRGVTQKDNKICFSSKEAAEIFSIGYIKCQNEHWGGREAMARYYILARALKEAINKRILSIEHFKMTDDDILSILENSKEENIINNLNLLKNGFLIKVSENSEGIKLNKKFRYIDPEVLVGNSLKRLSKVSRKYKSLLENERLNHISKSIIKIEGLK